MKGVSDFKVFADASDVAASVFLQGYDLIMHYHWINDESKISSTWREVKAIELCIESFSDKLQDSSITFYTDNQNARRIIKKGSKVPELQALALFIFETCLHFNISIFAQWIPRSENEKADSLSRIVDIDDWGISFEFFNFISSIWGPFTIDRFANMNNTKLPSI